MNIWLFGSGHFLVHFFRCHGSKNARIQKSCYNQKSVFSCSSTTRRNFWNPFISRPYFHTCLPELLPQFVTGTLTSKLFDLISMFWHDLPKNGWAGWIRDDRTASSMYTTLHFLLLWSTESGYFDHFDLCTRSYFENVTIFSNKRFGVYICLFMIFFHLYFSFYNANCGASRQLTLKK